MKTVTMPLSKALHGETKSYHRDSRGSSMLVFVGHHYKFECP